MVSVDRTALDFGNVWARKNITRILPVTNRTRGKVQIARFKVSCEDLSIEPQSIEIPAGETRNIQVTMDLTLPSLGEESIRQRDVAVSVMPVLEDGRKVDVWIVRAAVRSPLVLRPPNVRFDIDELIRNSDDHCNRLVDIEWDPEVVSITPVWARRLADVKIVSRSEDHRSAKLSIEPSTTQPLGSMEFGVRLRVKLKTGEEFETTPCRVSGVVSDEIEFLPSEVRFQPAAIGNVLEQSVVVRSRRGKPFAIASVEPPGGNTAVACSDARLSKAHLIRVRQTVAQPGLHGGMIRFTLKKGGSREILTAGLGTTYYGKTE